MIRRTLKNFLSTALLPVGKTLYIYGGGWNREDTKAGRSAVTLGLPWKWRHFFQNQSAEYDYRTLCKEGKERGITNYLCDWGADCSGYAGWCLYNVMENRSGREGLVFPGENMAKRLAEHYGWGRFSRRIEDPGQLSSGDLVSIEGHVWICLGVCRDKSVLIVHSTPSESICGKPGGGVQLSALGNCECRAYQLSDLYMRRYAPEWSRRYRAVWKPYSLYTDTQKEGSGHFTWIRGKQGLEDPEGFFEKDPEQILRELYGEDRR